MFTIMDYIKYYKNKDTREVPWNMMDNLLCAILVYAPLKTDYSSKRFSIFCKKVMGIEDIQKGDAMVPKVKEICKNLSDSKRYKDMRVVNFVNRVDEDTQFGAATFTLRGVKTISFKGTDTSIIGWIENIKLSYMYPTYTQILALNYLNSNIGFFDSGVRVVGHSKGGNLAMSSVMETSPRNYKKIKEVVNFDGPGFRDEEFNSSKFELLSKKLINIVPTGSYVGVLMNNIDYQVIKTNAHAIDVHYPINWSSYGTVFIEGELTKMSKELHRMTTENLRELNPESVKEVFEAVCEAFADKKTMNIHNATSSVLDVLKTMKGKDKEVVKYAKTILTTLIKSSKKKVN